MNDNNPQQNQINIELDEKIAEGIYSNLAIINHSNTEFVVDFVSMMPGIPKAKVKSRIVLTPQHSKRLLSALKEIENDGLIKLYPEKLLVTEKGKAFIRNICMAFDLRLKRIKPDRQLFSMTV